MPTQEDHTDKLAALLPRGAPWEGEDLRSLLRALAGDPARVDLAGEALLQDFMPDTCDVTGRFIPDWARLLGLPEAHEADAWLTYTNAQKQAAILAKLRYQGQVNINELQATYEALFDDTAIELRHKLHAPFAAGASGAGDGCGDAFQAVWTLEYMPNICTVNPDEFEAWDNVTVVDAAAQSPITLEQTADRVLLGTVVGDLAGGGVNLTAAAGDTVRCSMWIRTDDGTNKTITFAIQDRDGNILNVFEGQATPTWAKIEATATLTAGGTTPQMQLYGLVSETPEFMLSWAVAGVRRTPLETRAQQLAPRNTVGEFHCVVENSESTQLLDENGDLLFDEETGETLIDG